MGKMNLAVDEIKKCAEVQKAILNYHNDKTTANELKIYEAILKQNWELSPPNALSYTMKHVGEVIENEKELVRGSGSLLEYFNPNDYVEACCCTDFSQSQINILYKIADNAAVRF